jgi:hypothetical protein
VLADLIVAYLVPAGMALTVAVDDTLFHRSGRTVHAAAWCHDGAAKGPRKISWGNNWVVRHEVARDERTRGLEGRYDVGSVVPDQCSRSVPTSTGVTGDKDVRSLRRKAQGFPFHPGITGNGKAGRVNASKLPRMLRHVEPRKMESNTGV